MALPAAGDGASDTETCGEYVLENFYTAPSATYTSWRVPILAATAAAAAAIPLAALLATARSRGSQTWVAKLAVVDNFSSNHAVPRGEVLRNSPTPVGGAFTVAFLLAAAGLSLSILVQLWTRRFMVVQSIVDTPALASTSWMAGVHTGPVTLDVLLVGVNASSTCIAGAVTLAAPAAPWTLAAVAPVPLAAAAADPLFALPPLAPEAAAAGLQGCHATVVCAACRLTAATSVTLRYAWTYQSLVVAVRTRPALTGCAPHFRHAFAAPTAGQVLSTVTVAAQLRPVAFSYTGSLAAGTLGDGTGHDAVYEGVTATYKADPGLLQPGVDIGSLTLALTPTPYSTLIVVSDAMDALTVITSLVGLVSGLAGGFRFLMRKADGVAHVHAAAVRRRTLRGASFAAADAPDATKGGDSPTPTPASSTPPARFQTNPMSTLTTYSARRPGTGATTATGAARRVGELGGNPLVRSATAAAGTTAASSTTPRTPAPTALGFVPVPVTGTGVAIHVAAPSQPVPGATAAASAPVSAQEVDVDPVSSRVGTSV